MFWSMQILTSMLLCNCYVYCRTNMFNLNVMLSYKSFTFFIVTNTFVATYIVNAPTWRDLIQLVFRVVCNIFCVIENSWKTHIFDNTLTLKSLPNLSFFPTGFFVLWNISCKTKKKGTHIKSFPCFINCTQNKVVWKSLTYCLWETLDYFTIGNSGHLQRFG